MSIYAISSEARRMRDQRKASEQTNWTRGIFIVSNRASQNGHSDVVRVLLERNALDSRCS